MGLARKSLCIAEIKYYSSSSQEQGPSMYDEDRKALLVLEFMPKPEIEAFLADQGFVPKTFDMDDPRFIEQLDELKLYMLSKQMAFEDLTQRFTAVNNTISKTETQQKMTYVQVANSQQKQLRFFMEHSPKAWLIANSKPRQPKALLPCHSVPSSSSTSTLVAQNLVNITKRIRGGASAGDTVYQLRVRVDQVALDHSIEISIIRDIITTNIAAGMANFAKKWPRQLEYIELPSSTRTRWNREIPGGCQQNITDGDMKICGPPQNQQKYNQMKQLKHTLTVPNRLHQQKARQQQRFITLYLTNHLPDI
ncbi:MAG: hypothetical protein EZS28_039329 [Streblomastix strix]|uniref:Uncharacterized protein n=1 Tax=Streblomastix strix TaxID=222440 RepID=A0A5J4U605_9EUKA|nr:MAG: hypothetical protein EZS28_039329 [Streblomastix strix]